MFQRGKSKGTKPISIPSPSSSSNASSVSSSSFFPTSSFSSSSSSISKQRGVTPSVNVLESLDSLTAIDNISNAQHHSAKEEEGGKVEDEHEKEMTEPFSIVLPHPSSPSRTLDEKMLPSIEEDEEELRLPVSSASSRPPPGFSSSFLNSRVSPPPVKAGVTIASFLFLKLLGKGGYGSVYLVRHLSSSRLYAMKILEKSLLEEKRVAANARAECRLLSLVSHVNIVTLRFAFQSKKRLFLVMDFVPGGELFSRMSSVSSSRQMPESQVVFYSGQILLALRYLHARDIIYRDLKPENILIERNGYLKLTDFGFARNCAVQKGEAKSFCGTLCYMAPEMISGQGHGKASDLWALGVLICELLTSRPPFPEKDRLKLQESILNGPLNLPKFLSVPAKSIISSLCRKVVEKRLGCEETGPESDASNNTGSSARSSSARNSLSSSSSGGGIDAVMRHPFFASLNWAKLEAQTLTAPWKPQLESEEDVGFFDSRFTIQDVEHPPSPSSSSRSRSTSSVSPTSASSSPSSASFSPSSSFLSSPNSSVPSSPTSSAFSSTLTLSASLHVQQHHLSSPPSPNSSSSSSFVVSLSPRFKPLPVNTSASSSTSSSPPKSTAIFISARPAPQEQKQAQKSKPQKQKHDLSLEERAIEKEQEKKRRARRRKEEKQRQFKLQEEEKKEKERIIGFENFSFTRSPRQSPLHPQFVPSISPAASTSTSSPFIEVGTAKLYGHSGYEQIKVGSPLYKSAIVNPVASSVSPSTTAINAVSTTSASSTTPSTLLSTLIQSNIGASQNTSSDSTPSVAATAASASSPVSTNNSKASQLAAQLSYQLQLQKTKSALAASNSSPTPPSVADLPSSSSLSTATSPFVAPKVPAPTVTSSLASAPSRPTLAAPILSIGTPLQLDAQGKKLAPWAAIAVRNNLAAAPSVSGVVNAAPSPSAAPASVALSIDSLTSTSSITNADIPAHLQPQISIKARLFPALNETRPASSMSASQEIRHLKPMPHASSAVTAPAAPPQPKVEKQKKTWSRLFL